VTFSKGNAKASKLDAMKILEIRKRYALQQPRVTYEQLSREFMVTPGTIRNIVLGLTWQHVTEVPSDQEILRRMAMQATRLPQTEAEQQASAERIQALIAQRKKAVPTVVDETEGLTGMQRLMQEVEARRIANAEPSLDELMKDVNKPTEETKHD
jgi:hypothetical protein